MTPHLRDHVRPYIDRSLPEVLLHIYDQHLVACQACRAAADQERRIVAALRSTAAVPDSLRASLMGLARSGEAPGSSSSPSTPIPPAPGPRVGGSGIPAVPARQPVPASWVQAVPTVAPGAPALHRSPVRAAVLASVAAGASVVAALGISAAAPTSTTVSTGSPAARLGVPTSPAGSAGQVRGTTPQGPQVLLVRLPSAQSGP